MKCVMQSIGIEKYTFGRVLKMKSAYVIVKTRKLAMSYTESPYEICLSIQDAENRVKELNNKAVGCTYEYRRVQLSDISQKKLGVYSLCG